MKIRAIIFRRMYERGLRLSDVVAMMEGKIKQRTLYDYLRGYKAYSKAMLYSRIEKTATPDAVDYLKPCSPLGSDKLELLLDALGLTVEPIETETPRK